MKEETPQTLIETAVKNYIEEGGKLIQGQYGARFSDNKNDWVDCGECCALGCCLVEYRPENCGSRSLTLEKLLNVPTNWISSFEEGFDNLTPIEITNGEAYYFGKEMWDKYGTNNT